MNFFFWKDKKFWQLRPAILGPLNLVSLYNPKLISINFAKSRSLIISNSSSRQSYQWLWRAHSSSYSSFSCHWSYMNVSILIYKKMFNCNFKKFFSGFLISEEIFVWHKSSENTVHSSTVDPMSYGHRPCRPRHFLFSPTSSPYNVSDHSVDTFF